MRIVTAILGLLIMSSTASAAFVRVDSTDRQMAIDGLNQAILEHYQSLSLNEQYGVGMSCALGRLQILVKEAKNILIDEQKGLVHLDGGTRPNLFRGDVHYRLLAVYSLKTEQIEVVKVLATDKDGRTSICSTRNKLIDLNKIKEKL